MNNAITQIESFKRCITNGPCAVTSLVYICRKYLTFEHGMTPSEKATTLRPRQNTLIQLFEVFTSRLRTKSLSSIPLFVFELRDSEAWDPKDSL